MNDDNTREIEMNEVLLSVGGIIIHEDGTFEGGGFIDVTPDQIVNDELVLPGHEVVGEGLFAMNIPDEPGNYSMVLVEGDEDFPLGRYLVREA
jgi:hypothetical protein